MVIQPKHIVFGLGQKMVKRMYSKAKTLTRDYKSYRCIITAFLIKKPWSCDILIQVLKEQQWDPDAQLQQEDPQIKN